jgi:hypothetical protein
MPPDIVTARRREYDYSYTIDILSNLLIFNNI